MPDEEFDRFVDEALKRAEYRTRRRGHAPYWDADNKSQCWMEVGATSDWAEEMNSQGHQIDTDTIRKNPEIYPDCLTEMDGEKIGIEVTELVDTNGIKEHPDNPRYGGPEQFLREFAIPLPRLWSSDKLEKELVAIVRRKDEKGKSNSLSKQFLLIVTDEPGLDEAILSECLKAITLQQPRHFDGVYVMMSYVPNPAGKGRGHHSVFEVPLAG